MLERILLTLVSVYLSTPITADSVINVLSTLMQAAGSFTTSLNIY
jgi:hypothetical protein